MSVVARHLPPLSPAGHVEDIDIEEIMLSLLPQIRGGGTWGVGNWGWGFLGRSGRGVCVWRRVLRLGTGRPAVAFRGRGGAAGPDVTRRWPRPARLQLRSPRPGAGAAAARDSDRSARPWLRARRVRGRGARGARGRREGSPGPGPQSPVTALPSCPTEAETRQRLLRTVKKEVGAGAGAGAATPGGGERVPQEGWPVAAATSGVGLTWVGNYLL